MVDINNTCSCIRLMLCAYPRPVQYPALNINYSLLQAGRQQQRTQTGPEAAQRGSVCTHRKLRIRTEKRSFRKLSGHLGVRVFFRSPQSNRVLVFGFFRNLEQSQTIGHINFCAFARWTMVWVTCIVVPLFLWLWASFLKPLFARLTGSPTTNEDKHDVKVCTETLFLWRKLGPQLLRTLLRLVRWENDFPWATVALSYRVQFVIHALMDSQFGIELSAFVRQLARYCAPKPSRKFVVVHGSAVCTMYAVATPALFRCMRMILLKQDWLWMAVYVTCTSYDLQFALPLGRCHVVLYFCVFELRLAAVSKPSCFSLVDVENVRACLWLI